MSKILVKQKVKAFFTTEAEGAYNLITESTNRSFVSRYVKESATGVENFFTTAGTCFPIVSETSPTSQIPLNLTSIDGFHPVGYGTVVLSLRPVGVETGIGKMNGITGHESYNPVVRPTSAGRFGQSTADLRSNHHDLGISDEVIYDCVNPKLKGSYYLTFFIHLFGQNNSVKPADVIVGESYRLAVFAVTSGWPGWLYTGYSSNKSNFRPLDGSVLSGIGAKYALAAASSTPLVTYYNQTLAGYNTTMLDTAMYTGSVSKKPPCVIGINNAAIQMALLSANLSFINELSVESREIAAKTVVADPTSGFSRTMTLINEAPDVKNLLSPQILNAGSWEDLRMAYLAWEREVVANSGPQSMDVSNAVQANTNGVLDQIATGLSGNPIVPRAIASKILNNAVSTMQALRRGFLSSDEVRVYTGALRQGLQPQGLKRDRDAEIFTYDKPDPNQAKKALPPASQKALDQRDKLNAAREALLARFGGQKATPQAQQQQQTRELPTPPPQPTQSISTAERPSGGGKNDIIRGKGKRVRNQKDLDEAEEE